ncbi:MAG: hypothetical protein D6769_01170 [Methanobacteriota archaeon]|nr:MAG: hypothetical protein D6769_01170 [Euryarchaeota archaeon]
MAIKKDVEFALRTVETLLGKDKLSAKLLALSTLAMGFSLGVELSYVIILSPKLSSLWQLVGVAIASGVAFLLSIFFVGIMRRELKKYKAPLMALRLNISMVALAFFIGLYGILLDNLTIVVASYIAIAVAPLVVGAVENLFYKKWKKEKDKKLSGIDIDKFHFTPLALLFTDAIFFLVIAMGVLSP